MPLDRQEWNRRISEGLRLAWKRRKGKAMKSGSSSSYRAALSGTGADMGGERDDEAPTASEPKLSHEELTERFYLVRGQRNKLLWACQKALAAYDAANSTGNGKWNGKDVDEMRAAVAECEPQPVATYIGTAQILTCANCNQESTSPGQFLKDGRWVCTDSCRRELADSQSYDDLAASGGIVEAP